MSFFLSALHAFFFCRILRWTVRVKDTVTHTCSMFLAALLALLLSFSPLGNAEESKSDISLGGGYAYTTSEFSKSDVEKYGDSKFLYHNFILGASYSNSQLDADFLYFLPTKRSAKQKLYYQETTRSGFLLAASTKVKIQRYFRPYLGVGVLSQTYSIKDRYSLTNGLKHNKLPNAQLASTGLIFLSKYKFLEKENLSVFAYYSIGGDTRFALGITYWFYEL